MKKLNLNDFAKANVTIEKKAMMTVKGGDAEAESKRDTSSKMKMVEFNEAYL